MNFLSYYFGWCLEIDLHAADTHAVSRLVGEARSADVVDLADSLKMILSAWVPSEW